LGIAHEKKLAKELGGRPQPGSGSGAFRKEDVFFPGFLCQEKETAKSFMSVQARWLRQLDEHAMGRSKIPLLNICFTRPDGVREWMGFPENDVEKVLHYNVESWQLGIAQHPPFHTPNKSLRVQVCHLDEAIRDRKREGDYDYTLVRLDFPILRPPAPRMWYLMPLDDFKRVVDPSLLGKKAQLGHAGSKS
jgi:hypothetical protein